jgi:hypothetical protein
VQKGKCWWEKSLHLGMCMIEPLSYLPIQWPSPDGRFLPAAGVRCLSYRDDVQMQLHRQSGYCSPSSLAQLDMVPEHSNSVNEINSLQI